MKATRHRYTGQYLDPETGLYYYEARYYDPKLGRFVCPDSLFIINPEFCTDSPVECNLYSYTSNNPLRYIDESGNFKVEANLVKNYPLATKFIQNITPEGKYKTFNNLTGASPSQVNQAYKPNSGLNVGATSKSGVNGVFYPKRPDNIYLHKDLFEKLEKALKVEQSSNMLSEKQKNSVAGIKTLIESTVDHESGHAFAHKNGFSQHPDGSNAPDVGKKIEKDIYGADVGPNNANDIAKKNGLYQK